jgi:hypothetical protein
VSKVKKEPAYTSLAIVKVTDTTFNLIKSVHAADHSVLSTEIEEDLAFHYVVPRMKRLAAELWRP